jgi:hypothetical protein
MNIRAKLLICSALLACAETPAMAEAPAAPKMALAESALPSSKVSVAVEPALSDGRLIVKVAALNRSKAPVSFGPGNVRIARIDGSAIAITPVEALIADVRVAAGLPAATGPTTAAPSTTYASPQMNVTSQGQVDVRAYTGGMGVGADEAVRRAPPGQSKAKPTISVEQADQQIAALKLAILQDSTLKPGEIAAGQIVSEPLKFKKGADRTIHLWVQIAGDEHSFTLAAPAK